MGSIIRRLASPWNEFAVTWNTEPVWAEIRSEAANGSFLNWYQWDVTSLVADWAGGIQDNHGMEIIGDEAIQHCERAFYSRETATGFFPRLVVDYTDLGDVLPPIVSVDPLPEFSPRVFTVSWSGVDQGGAGIDYYDVQFRVDGGDWTDWLMGIDFTSADFTGENSRLYEFRARGADNVGNMEPFGDPEAQTIVDTVRPVSSVNPLPAIINENSFTVSWTGDDGDGSGISHSTLCRATSMDATGLSQRELVEVFQHKPVLIS